MNWVDKLIIEYEQGRKELRDMHEQLETDKESMNKLIKSKDNKKKQAMITKLKELA